MLAALGGEVETVFFCHVGEGVEDSLAHFTAGVAADHMGSDLAGGAANNKDLTRFHIGDLNQFLCNGFCLFIN